MRVVSSKQHYASNDQDFIFQNNGPRAFLSRAKLRRYLSLMKAALPSADHPNTHGHSFEGSTDLLDSATLNFQSVSGQTLERIEKLRERLKEQDGIH
jgi:hypothetical protein